MFEVFAVIAVLVAFVVINAAWKIPPDVSEEDTQEITPVDVR